jgi:hypothetical protein
MEAKVKKAIKDIEAPNAAAALKATPSRPCTTSQRLTLPPLPQALVGVLDSFKKAVTKELQDASISAGTMRSAKLV